MAADSAGNAVIAWFRSDGANDRVEAVAIPAGGAPGALQPLSAPGQNALVPRVSMAGTGRAIVAWHRYDGLNYRIQSSQDP